MLAKPPERLWDAIERYVPPWLVNNWCNIAKDLVSEIGQDYKVAVKKSIGTFLFVFGLIKTGQY